MRNAASRTRDFSDDQRATGSDFDGRLPCLRTRSNYGVVIQEVFFTARLVKAFLRVVAVDVCSFRLRHVNVDRIEHGHPFRCPTV
jgi:hypothetical protein